MLNTSPRYSNLINHDHVPNTIRQQKKNLCKINFNEIYLIANPAEILSPIAITIFISFSIINKIMFDSN